MIAEQASAEARQSGSPMAIASTPDISRTLAESSPDQATRLLVNVLRAVALPGQQNSQQMAGMSLIALRLGQAGTRVGDLGPRALAQPMAPSRSVGRRSACVLCPGRRGSRIPNSAGFLSAQATPRSRRADPDAKPGARRNGRGRGVKTAPTTLPFRRCAKPTTSPPRPSGRSERSAGPRTRHGPRPGRQLHASRTSPPCRFPLRLTTSMQRPRHSTDIAPDPHR